MRSSTAGNLSSFNREPFRSSVLRNKTFVCCFGHHIGAEAVSRGDGVLVMDGRLVENLHVANAQRIVELADAIEARSLATVP